MCGRGVVVEPLGEGDVGSVVDIVRGLPEWFTGDAVEAVAVDAGRMMGFVARVDGVVRGFVLLDVRECCVEIAWIAVERGWRGRGIGSLLLEAAESYACSLDKPVLTVKTYGGMDYEPYMETLRFYRRRGFKLYEIIEDYKPFNGQPAAVLIKRLACNNR